MMTELWIVESPDEEQAIRQALGGQADVWVVTDELRDFARTSLDLAAGGGLRAAPTVLTPVAEDLRRIASPVTVITIATDPDREGEELAWHIQHMLLEKQVVRRVVLDQLTPGAIRSVMRTPRPVDVALVEAHKARRILEYLVATLIFPLLQAAPGGSPKPFKIAEAAALRLLVGRERSRAQFQAKHRWCLTLQFSHAQTLFFARLASPDFLAGEQQRAVLVKRFRATSQWRVETIETLIDTVYPPAPFTTSTLLQEAARVLQLAPHQTVASAERLYTQGLVTFPRTASAFIAPEAQSQARQAIINTFGQPYTPAEPPRYRSGAALQETREAIRPSDVAIHPDLLSSKAGPGELFDDDHALYGLIWRRFLASQMKPAAYAVTMATISGGEIGHPLPYVLVAHTRAQTFPGFLRASPSKLSADDLYGAIDSASDLNSLLPPMKTGDALTLHKVIASERAIAAPERFTPARLVASMEAAGFGRPASYASTLKELFDREYVQLEEGFIVPTVRGEHILDYLMSSCGELFSVHVAAEVETLLDEIATGQRAIHDVIESFYQHRIQPAVRSASAARMLSEKEES